MSEFTVRTSVIADHAARLVAIAPELDQVVQPLAGSAGAAERTPVAGTVEELSAHVVSTMAHFALAGQRLHVAMVAAASEYARADAEVARTAR
jgi:hypothetical protein